MKNLFTVLAFIVTIFCLPTVVEGLFGATQATVEMIQLSLGFGGSLKNIAARNKNNKRVNLPEDVLGKTIRPGSLGFISVGDFLVLCLVKEIDSPINQNDLKVTYPNWGGDRWVTTRRNSKKFVSINTNSLLEYKFHGPERTHNDQRRMLISRFEEMNGPTDSLRT